MNNIFTCFNVKEKLKFILCMVLILMLTGCGTNDKSTESSKKDDTTSTITSEDVSSMEETSDVVTEQTDTIVNNSVNRSFRPAGYKKVWGDDFNGNKIDDKKWMFLDGMGSTPDMVSITTSDVARVENGLLKMESIHYFDPFGDPKVQYATNICLTTAGTMNYKYGYLEMCAKLSFKKGMWPAFWTKGVNEVKGQDFFLTKSTYEYMPEVDIFEVFGSTDTLTFNLHKWTLDGVDDFYHTSLDHEKYDRSYTFTNSDNLSNEFHVYGFEWTPEKMAVSVDGEKYFEYDLKKNFDTEGKNTGMDCFKVPMYLVFSNFLFTPEGGYDYELINASDLPGLFHIDWINLYQKPGVGELYALK